jgi:Ca-activated chloride channel family protein
MTTMPYQEPAAQRPGRYGASVLKSVRANGSVKGLLFELAVEQCYVNDGDRNIEAVYTFPVAWNAVLLGVEVILGDKVLQGKIVAKADGERVYEAALEEGNSPVMVERAGDGMYTVNVGNLLPREQAIVRFRYAQLLSFSHGRIRLVVPTVIAPRYGDPGRAGLQPHQVPVTDPYIDYPFSLGITLYGEMAGAALHSPSHAVTVRSIEGNVEVALHGAARLDRDFVLLAENLADKSVTTLGRDGDGYVALASFCPAGEALPATAPLNLKILVDCSGSMNGARIEAARHALHEILGHLEPADSFSYSCFGSDTRHFSTSLMAATARAIRKASEWVAATQADMGGTELQEAVLSTFALAQPCTADVLLITDGDVWETDKLIAAAGRAGQRVFAVGIGSAPASSLLHALAGKTGGACELVAADTEIQSAITSMVHRMRQLPVRDVTVAWDSPSIWQTGPSRRVPRSETVHHFAGFAERAPAGAVLGWRDDTGVTQHQLGVQVDTALVEGDTLARVAAAARMSEAEPLDRHALALKYELVSPTTNLVLVHEREALDRPKDMPALHAVAQSLPAGWGGIGKAAGGPLRAPAVWRREQASTVLRCAQNSGVETYDIPVFLRKQKESPAPYLYRESLRRFIDTLVPAGAERQPGDDGPITLGMLEGSLPEPVARELRMLVSAGLSEEDVVRAFVAALAAHFQSAGITQRAVAAVRWSFNALTGSKTDLERRVEAVVSWAVNVREEGAASPDIPAWMRHAAD